MTILSVAVLGSIERRTSRIAFGGLFAVMASWSLSLMVTISSLRLRLSAFLSVVAILVAIAGAHLAIPTIITSLYIF